MIFYSYKPITSSGIQVIIEDGIFKNFEQIDERYAALLSWQEEGNTLFSK